MLVFGFCVYIDHVFLFVLKDSCVGKALPNISAFSSIKEFAAIYKHKITTNHTARYFELIEMKQFLAYKNTSFMS